MAVPELSLGIVGGSLESAVGYVHQIASRMDGRFRVVAGCFSQREEVNRQTAAAAGVVAERCHGDWRRMLERERGKLDAVLMLTPTPVHAEMVGAALELGYPVICEKALACTVEEILAVRAAVERTGGFLAVTYNYTGYPMVRELRRLIQDGGLGRLINVQVEMPQEGFIRVGTDGQPLRHQSWRLRDGPIPTVSLDLGVHVHHLVAFTCDRAPLEVVATGDSFGHNPAVVDNVQCIARYQGGMSAQFWYGKVALGQSNGLRLRVFGSEGAAEWYQMNPEYLRLWDNQGRETVLTRASNGVQMANQARYNRFKAGHPAGFIEAFANLYVDIADALLARRRGAAPATAYVADVCIAEEGMRLLRAIAISAQTGNWQPAGA